MEIPKDWWEEELIRRIGKIIDQERWSHPCLGCPEGHSSFWKTITESPQWEEWSKSQDINTKYDMAEVEECGWISQEHFQAFLKFVIGKEKK